MWSGSSGQLVFNLCKQVQPVYCLAPSPDGECPCLAILLRKRFFLTDCCCHHYLFLPVGDFIATGSLGGNVSIWSLSKGSCLREVQGSGDTFDVSWSADGTLLCSCFSSGTLCVLDTTASTAGVPALEAEGTISTADEAVGNAVPGADGAKTSTADSVAETTETAAATEEMAVEDESGNTAE